ncbi:MAG: type II/IV secretion system ATPase subunit [Lachnospiraceae bacterium]|nr:type II/IV secretion system ATPase subunit [Lachnospiraceae bacterium]
MNDFQKKFMLKRQDYGILYPYLISDEVTDINWNGRQLWIDDLNKGRYMAPEVLPETFVERFISLLSNLSSEPFNRRNPVLEAETEELRISIVHSCVAHSGTTISLRKIPAVRRLEKSEMVQSGYCSEEVADFLVHCIQAHCSVAVCGLPGAGKTELLKYLTKFIPASERVITIEDVLEIHYRKINPNKDCVEMKVAENFSYTEAIKASLRQLPKWIILSEARSTEVRYLLESLSTGTCGLTTLHTDDVRNIPDRMKNMAGGQEDLNRIENDTYRFIDVGILVKSFTHEDGKICRRVEQIGIFDRYGREWKETINEIVMVVEDGKIVSRKLPVNVRRKFVEAGIVKPLGGSLE